MPQPDSKEEHRSWPTGQERQDNCSEVSHICEALTYFPEDVRLKKLAGQLLLMAQSGLYNYERCLRHGEPYAAQMALWEFVKSSMSIVFLLNKRYQPYYKWGFRALKELPLLSDLHSKLGFLLETDNSESCRSAKIATLEDIVSTIIEELHAQELVRDGRSDLEPLAYSVNDRIADSTLRNMHIFAAT